MTPVSRKSFVWGSKIDPTDPESKTVAFYGFDPFEDEARLMEFKLLEGG